MRLIESAKSRLFFVLTRYVVVQQHQHSKFEIIIVPAALFCEHKPKCWTISKSSLYFLSAHHNFFCDGLISAGDLNKKHSRLTQLQEKVFFMWPLVINNLSRRV